MRLQMAIIALILSSSFLSKTVFAQPDQDFDALLKQATTEKQAQWQMYEGEIQRVDTEFERLWQERKAEIEQKWDEALRSTQKEWVEHSPSLDARSYVNFDEGFVEITAIVPVEEEDILPKAEKLISNQMKKVFSSENKCGQNLLEGQVAFKIDHPVSPGTISLFIQKTKKKLMVGRKPFVPKDNVPRVKVKVRFELLPNHLQIRAKKYYDLVDQNSKRFQVPAQLIMAVIHTESYFNPLAVSPANAHGLMQLIPKYGARDAYRIVHGKDRVVSPEYLYVPRNNVELGSAYLSLLGTSSFKRIQDEAKRLYLVICAYNWGPGSISRKIIKRNDIGRMTPSQLYRILRQQVPEETANYLQRVTKRMRLYAPIFGDLQFGRDLYGRI